MSAQRERGGGGTDRGQSRGRQPLRRASDPTLLLGDARPLTLGAAVAAMLGGLLAATSSRLLAPIAFTLSAVVTVGLLAAARRTDVLARPDSLPDRSPRTRRALAAIVLLAVVGTAWSAWTITAGDAYDSVDVPFADEVGVSVDVLRRVVLSTLLSLIVLGVPLGAVWALDFLKARFRPSRHAVVAEIPLAVWADGSLHRADADAVLLVSNDMFRPAEISRRRRIVAFDLTFAVTNPRSPLRPPIGTVSSRIGPVVASHGVVVDERSILGRVPLNLRDTWIFELDPERTRTAAHDPTTPDFQAAYGRLVLLRASTRADPIELGGLIRLAKQLALQARSTVGGDTATAQEMLEFVDVNVSAPRDLPRARTPDPADSPALPVGSGAYEFVGFEGAITFDDFEELEEPEEPDAADELDDRS